MGKVVSSAMMSLDGYIAKADNTIGRLFDSLGNGEVEIPTASPDITFHMTEKTARYWRAWMDSVGAIVVGRTLFDFTDGWGGRHTMDAPVVVVTHEVPTGWVDAHPDAPFTFVTDGVVSAIEQAKDIAGDKVVGLHGATVMQQALPLGLVDEIRVHVVPVLLGGGTPLFASLDSAIGLERTDVQVTPAATHLRFRVLR